MTDHPAERLRNKLTPLFNLIEILSEEGTNLSFSDENLNKIFKDELENCRTNIPEIKKWLDIAERLV